MVTETEVQRGTARSAAVIGIFVLMCASVMTFSALVSAMVVRRGLNSTDWHRVSLPHILYWNTIVLLLSSVALDVARRLLKRGKRTEFNWFWTVGTLLGTWFLVGQVIAWTQVEGHIRGSLSSAFFYVLTWAHAAHVVGALGAVGFVDYKALRYQLGPRNRTAVDVSAIFWHFLDVLWLGLMALFVFWS
jgi:cytochrome c oxidase subunit III